jgi:hypothetical protein
MSWPELADLPFASALTVHEGGLAAHEEYDTVMFDGRRTRRTRGSSSARSGACR